MVMYAVSSAVARPSDILLLTQPTSPGGSRAQSTAHTGWYYTFPIKTGLDVG